MPAMNIDRSILIDADAEKVFDVVADFSTWQTWSPWLCADKDAKVIVSDDPKSLGSGYSWDGEVVGAGEMEHKKLDRPNKIEDELRFTRPWTSTSAVILDLKRKPNGTELTWRMRGKLPWFMFWMRSTMESLVGMDYERGLRMLKEYIETGEINSNTEVLGVVSVPERTVDGIRLQCKMKDIGDSMNKGYCEIEPLIAGKTNENTEMIGVYHNLNMKTQDMDLTCGFTTESTETQAPMKRTKLPAGKALHVRHTGSYEHVGNGWSSAYQVARYKKLKMLRSQPTYEIYRNDPETTPVEELVTDIYLPVK